MDEAPTSQEIDDFVVENRRWLSDEAEDILRAMDGQDQRNVLAEGSMSNCRDPVAIVKSRAWNGHLKAHREWMEAHKNDSKEELVEAFISANLKFMNPEAEEALRKLDSEGLWRVADFGSLQGCRDATAIIKIRARSDGARNGVKGKGGKGGKKGGKDSKGGKGGKGDAKGDRKGSKDDRSDGRGKGKNDGWEGKGHREERRDWYDDRRDWDDDRRERSSRDDRYDERRDRYDERRDRYDERGDWSYNDRRDRSYDDRGDRSYDRRDGKGQQGKGWQGNERWPEDDWRSDDRHSREDGDSWGGAVKEEEVEAEVKEEEGDNDLPGNMKAVPILDPVKAKEDKETAEAEGRVMHAMGLPPLWSAQQIESFFSHQGEVGSVHLMNVQKGKNTRAAYVYFKTKEDCTNAAMVCDRLEIEDRSSKFLLECSIKLKAAIMGRRFSYPARGEVDPKIAQLEGRTVYLSRLPLHVTQDAVRELSENFGEVEAIHQLPGNSIALAFFVTMVSPGEAAFLIRDLNNSQVFGSIIQASYPVEKNEKRKKPHPEDETIPWYPLEIRNFPHWTTVEDLKASVATVGPNAQRVRVMHYDPQPMLSIARAYFREESDRDASMNALAAYEFTPGYELMVMALPRTAGNGPGFANRDGPAAKVARIGGPALGMNSPPGGLPSAFQQPAPDLSQIAATSLGGAMPSTAAMNAALPWY
mmetsp:Transcript_77545/g.136812  ORF Transcript_77545/g.136812 Transcript_77545/m.136812 type:complete len:700 (-) Transcript_77545:30-2129(-)